jgi:FtsH-binding integral membrane protein
MAESNNWLAQGGTVARPQQGVIDQGLRSYMVGVYNYMAAGIALTGLVAYAVFAMAVTTDPTQAAQGVRALSRGMFLTDFGRLIFASPLAWVIMFAPLGFALFLGFRVYKMSVAGAQIAFWLFAAVMGLSLATIFLRFTGVSIARTFFITAATFAMLSLYGYTTKRDLSGWGTFLFMGVIGLIIAGLVNIFLQSPALQFAISCIGVLVFAGLTAYDTQQIKDGYYELVGDAQMLAKGAIMGALNLYLDFINMFTMLLNLTGDRE